MQAKFRDMKQLQLDIIQMLTFKKSLEDFGYFANLGFPDPWFSDFFFFFTNLTRPYKHYKNK